MGHRCTTPQHEKRLHLAGTPRLQPINRREDHAPVICLDPAEWPHGQENESYILDGTAAKHPPTQASASSTSRIPHVAEERREKENPNLVQGALQDPLRGRAKRHLAHASWLMASSCK